MRKSTPYTPRLSSADGGQTVDIHDILESDIIKLAYECGMTGNPDVLAKVPTFRKKSWNGLQLQ